LQWTLVGYTNSLLLIFFFETLIRQVIVQFTPHLTAQLNYRMTIIMMIIDLILKLHTTSTYSVLSNADKNAQNAYLFRR